ncbi:MAG TPA: permease-like cell division protein FtsX, partial [Candidatus Woesebacteria bacterium]|nr:permease-like cell division protein FtsX [Candidatus Woesebacteria bacterium]
IQGLLGYVETRPRVIVYFQIKATEEEIFAVRDKLEDSGKTKEVTYVSKAQAYDIYKELTKNDPLLLEMTSEDILPASLEIDALEPEYLPEIAEMLANEPGVDEVQFQKDIVDNLLALTSNIRRISLVFFGYLLFVSIIVLTITISFKIALKKDEIALLKLLGASNDYIRKPFIQESILLGLFATGAANVILIGMLIALNSLLSGYLSGIPTLTMTMFGIGLQVWPFNIAFILATMFVTIFFSLVISLIASLSATNRYL